MTDKEIMEKDIKIKDWKWSEEHQNFVKNDCCQKARQSERAKTIEKIDNLIEVYEKYKDSVGVGQVSALKGLKKSIEADSK